MIDLVEMSIRVMSKERKEGTCPVCGDRVYDMAFIKTIRGDYGYVCLDCCGSGKSRRRKKAYNVIEIDEARLAREEVLSILIDYAREDEVVFRDSRLNVVEYFRNEILENKMNPRLESYIKFNGNAIHEVLRLRKFALEAVNYPGELYGELVELYKSSRIMKLSTEQKNRVKVLLTLKDVQVLDEDYRTVWERMVDIRSEVDRYVGTKRYDNIDEIVGILKFLDKKSFLTERQLKVLRSFYYEMRRRNKVV